MQNAILAHWPSNVHCPPSNKKNLNEKYSENTRQPRFPITSAAHTSQVWGGKERQAAALWSTTWVITHWRARARACWRAAVFCSKELGSRLSGRRSGQKAELCRSSGWPTPRLQGSQQTIDDGLISSYMVLPQAARPCAAMQQSCHPSDAMAAPKQERLSGMGSQLRRHSTASWHVTPSSLAVAPIACALLPGLERRIPALGAAPRCNACAPCPCHAAHRSLTGCKHYRDRVPALSLSCQAMLRSQPTRGSMAHRHTLRAGHHDAATSKADRVAAPGRDIDVVKVRENWPLVPTASRATRTQARSATLAHRTKTPVLRQARVWSPRASTGPRHAGLGPQRLGLKKLHDVVDRILWKRARVQLNWGKTRVWNAAASHRKPPKRSRGSGLGWGLGAPTAPARPHRFRHTRRSCPRRAAHEDVIIPSAQFRLLLLWKLRLPLPLAPHACQNAGA